MPNVYISPSLQEYNPYVGGGNEEYYMNLVADKLVPYLSNSGVTYTRNDPSDKLIDVINESNEENYDLHLAIHSNAAGSENAGNVRGTDVYYYPGSEKGERFADLIVEEFKKIYPNPDLVKKVPTTTLAEVRRVNAPSVLVEVAYHDNPDDAMWIRNNINNIGRSLATAITEYLGVPLIGSSNSNQGTVVTQTSALNIRRDPSTGAEIIGQIPKGAIVKIFGKLNDWYSIEYDGKKGYASSHYIRF